MLRLAIVLVLALPGLAAAQGKPPKVGFADAGTAECKADQRIEGFHAGLRQAGYALGKNIELERRCYASADELRKVLGGFVAAKVNVIAVGTPQAAAAARALTRDIPIVCASCGDPVGNGLAKSLRQPGSNVTGFASLSAELIGKRLGLLKEAAPKISRVAALINPDNPGAPLTVRALEEAGQALGLAIVRIEFRSSADFDRALAAAAASGAGAMLIADDPYVGTRRKELAEFGLKNRWPVSGGSFELAEEGVLMAYGANRVDLYRRAAGYVDRILKGAKPAEMPFEQAAKLDFVVNLKTAKAIGLPITEALLLQTTRIIE